MAESHPLSGPDLSVGVAADSVKEGQPLLGHAEGEAVMLVRTGGRLFAAAASCTHYGGPLAEGLVVGTRVHCPWHHACFDLETGLPAGPALKPIACFDVISAADLVRVGKRLPPYAAPPARGPSSVVIVGAGPAGVACADMLRQLGYSGAITLLGDEPPGPVDRPNLSKDYLAGEAEEGWIPLHEPDYYREQRIDLILGDAAKRIDSAQHRVQLASGRSLDYGALLLATGSAARRLPIPGAELDHVLTLRTLADSRAIIAKAKPGARAVIIGTSFIGLEVAASLRARDVAVDVIAMEAIPLAKVMGEKLGRYVQKLHEDHGVTFHLGRKPSKIERDRVSLDDGSVCAADFVVMGVGVSPRTELAEQAGLQIERGVAVDEHLQTSAPDIYAAGDIAAFPDVRSGERVRIEHFAVAERQGQAVARAMLGQATPYRDVPFFWSEHYDKNLAYIGHAQDWDRSYERGNLSEPKYVTAFEHKGKILAVICLAEDHLGLRVEAAMQAGDEAQLKALVTGA